MSNLAATIEDLSKRVINAKPLTEIVLYGDYALRVGAVSEERMWECARIVRQVTAGAVPKDQLPLAAAKIICHLVSEHHPDITPEEVKDGVTPAMFERIGIEVARKFGEMMNVVPPAGRRS